MLIAFGVSGVLGLAAVAAIIGLTSGGGGDTANAADVAPTLAAAGCTFKTVKATGRQHVTNLDAKIKYNTWPPSNGNRYFSPAIWGFYGAAANPIQVVHNEEHGGVTSGGATRCLRRPSTSCTPSTRPAPTACSARRTRRSATRSLLPPGRRRQAGPARVGSRLQRVHGAFTAFRDAFRGRARGGSRWTR